ncbi:hypothetical protein BJV82DRAFT_384772 [Fennellomyces sp. T-0311]|nr:hypothetical protein BJV82DRAFT_384772 [Fennellomyces sp. T-0311]
MEGFRIRYYFSCTFCLDLMLLCSHQLRAAPNCQRWVQRDAGYYCVSQPERDRSVVLTNPCIRAHMHSHMQL